MVFFFLWLTFSLSVKHSRSIPAIANGKIALSVFIIKCDVSFGFFHRCLLWCLLSWINSLLFLIFNVFDHKGMLDFLKCFFCVYWDNIWVLFFITLIRYNYIVFFNLYLLISEREEGRGRKRGRERNIRWLPPCTCFHWGSNPQPKLCALTGDRALKLLMYETRLQPTEPPGQGLHQLIFGYYNHLAFLAYMLFRFSCILPQTLHSSLPNYMLFHVSLTQPPAPFLMSFTLFSTLWTPINLLYPTSILSLFFPFPLILHI